MLDDPNPPYNPDIPQDDDEKENNEPMYESNNINN